MSETAIGQPSCGACRSSIAAEDRFCRRCGAVLGGPDPAEPDARKHVTIVFIDLVGSTAMAERLDPEVLRRILAQYYQACAECVADHGGTIEKFIGDAVMAVFGVPASHEEDAVRGVRAAHAAITAVQGLGASLVLPGFELNAHAGVSAGEVVVILAPGTHLRIIGDPVNTAARLQSAAAAGEILVNTEAAHLTRRLVALEPVPPLTLKGKARPVPAWRVTSLAAAPPIADRAPLIGRAGELRVLQRFYQRTVDEGACYRVLVTGPPGIGKSRLVREFLDDGLSPRPLVLTGRCQPYGKDITYQPLASMLIGSLATSSEEGWRQLLGQDDDVERAAHGLAAMLGKVPVSELGRVGTEEIAWAASRLFGALTACRPLILLWDDLHWAEPTLLQLIDDLAARLATAPVLMVCLARHETSRWNAGSRDGRIQLGPLDQAETLWLVEALIGESCDVQAQAQPVAARVAQFCAGNPLFATVMADMLAEEVEITGVPPTVSAVLHARIDALPPGERLVLQMAAICGHDFGQVQLVTLAAGQHMARSDLEKALTGLVQRDLLRLGSNGRHRFAETLIHETAYGTVSKAQRARCHAALANFSSVAPGAAQENTVYHAETACLLYREINPDDPSLPSLVAKATQLLTAEGTIALHRKDLQAAIALLQRALDLEPQDTSGRAVILLRLSDALLAAGDSDAALDVLPGGEGVWTNATDQRTVALQRGIVLLRLGMVSFDAARELRAAYHQELSGCPGEDINWCLLHQFNGLLELNQGRGGTAVVELRNALRRAVAFEDRYTQDRLLGALCELAQWSPMSVRDGLAVCQEVMERFEADRLLLIPVLSTRARLLALRGDIGAARETLATARDYSVQMHASLAGIAVTQTEALVQAVAGDHDNAATLFESAATELRAHGHVLSARTLEIYAVREILYAGHLAAAASAFSRVAADVAGQALDVRARTWLRLVQASLACAQGRARDGAAIAEQSIHSIDADDLCLLGDAWLEYARILHHAGRPGEALAAATQAEAHFAVKGATSRASAAHAWKNIISTGESGKELWTCRGVRTLCASISPACRLGVPRPLSGLRMCSRWPRWTG